VTGQLRQRFTIFSSHRIFSSWDPSILRSLLQKSPIFVGLVYEKGRNSWDNWQAPSILKFFLQSHPILVGLFHKRDRPKAYWSEHTNSFWVRAGLFWLCRFGFAFLSWLFSAHTVLFCQITLGSFWAFEFFFEFVQGLFFKLRKALFGGSVSVFVESLKGLSAWKAFWVDWRLGWRGSFYVTFSSTCRTLYESIQGSFYFDIVYRVVKTHRIPYLCRSFSAKVTYI